MDGWMDEWMHGWMDGWMVEPVKDCLQQSKIKITYKIIREYIIPVFAIKLSILGKPLIIFVLSLFILIFSINQ